MSANYLFLVENSLTVNPNPHPKNPQTNPPYIDVHWSLDKHNGAPSLPILSLFPPVVFFFSEREYYLCPSSLFFLKGSILFSSSSAFHLRDCFLRDSLPFLTLPQPPSSFLLMMRFQFEIFLFLGKTLPVRIMLQDFSFARCFRASLIL